MDDQQHTAMRAAVGEPGRKVGGSEVISTSRSGLLGASQQGSRIETEPVQWGRDVQVQTQPSG